MLDLLVRAIVPLSDDATVVTAVTVIE